MLPILHLSKGGKKACSRNFVTGITGLTATESCQLVAALYYKYNHRQDRVTPVVPRLGWSCHQSQQDHTNPPATTSLLPASNAATSSFLPPQAQGWFGQCIPQKSGMEYTGVETQRVMPKFAATKLAPVYFLWASSAWSFFITLPKLMQSTFAKNKSSHNCYPPTQTKPRLCKSSGLFI